MNPTYEAVTFTPAGQCVVALTLALGATWSLPDEGGPNVIERAANGDPQERQWAREIGAPVGALPETVDLVISALADARAHGAQESEEAQVPMLLSALVMRLVDAHYPDVDPMAFAEALMSVKHLEAYLLRRLHGDTQPEPATTTAKTMYVFARAAEPLPADPRGDNALSWVSARQAEWLDEKLRATRMGHAAP
jgi:hypothetical protein